MISKSGSGFRKRSCSNNVRPGQENEEPAMDDMDDRIRQRAYRLWVEEGCPEGRQEIHWDRARELVAIEQNQKHTTKPVTHHQGAGGEPVEPMEAIENAGEFPTQTDQGEEQGTPQ